MAGKAESRRENLIHRPALPGGPGNHHHRGEGKNRESYAVIVEKALQTLKKQGYRPPVLKHFSNREEVLARAATREHHPPVIPVTSHGEGAQPRVLIDDLANYPSLEDIEREQAEKEQNGIYELKANEGLITRLLRSSAGPFGRKKKWFK